MTTSDFKSFNYLENGDVSFSNYDTVKSTKALDAGCYKLSYLEYPENKVSLQCHNDGEYVKIHSFPDKQKIDDLFKSFFEKRVFNKINRLGFYHKIGVLLYGKEGTGKSTIVKHYYNRAISENNAIAFYMNCYDNRLKECWGVISNIRRIQTNPVIIIFEEFDEYLNEKANEAVLKTILDGNLSIDNCISFATTNYIDKIPDAMKNRPSRFKYSLNIEGIQNKDDIYKIVSKMLSDTFSEAENISFSNQLIGKDLDCIKQFCIDKIMDIKSYSMNTKNKVGFLQTFVN